VKKRRSIIGGLAALGLTMVTVLALPGVANAAALATESVQLGSSISSPPPAVSTWDFSSTSRYWSIAAVYSDSDYDLDVSSGGTRLSASLYGAGQTDFIAIDSNDGRRPTGASYQATVRRYSGTADFAVEQMQGRIVVNLPVPANDGVSGPGDPDIAIVGVPSDRLATISDMYLNAGDAFWVRIDQLDEVVFFLESNPAVPATWVRNRTSAVSSAAGQQIDGCVLYTAHYSGWHAIVVMNQIIPHVTNPRTGSGFPLIRYSPSRPNSCPVKNFPGPTP